MDPLNQYRQYVETLLTARQATPDNGDIECQLILDTQRDHYQLVDFGWNDQQRIYHCIIHIDIKDGKIWIQRNQTDEPITDELVAMGVAKTDIILCLQPPAIRELLSSKQAQPQSH